MIELKNVTKIYKSKKSISTKALDDVSLKLGNIGMVFIVGKSGSGKSTLLNLLGGLDSVTNGDIIVDNKKMSRFKTKDYDSYRNTCVGFIFQEFNVLDEYNVYENIDLALRLQDKKDKTSEISKLLVDLGLDNLEKRKINELSGGQKQRVAIARALIKKPKIILADEPTGNLDRASSEQIFEILKKISKEKLVVIVSHDLESALKYADRIIKIEDGKVIEDDGKEIDDDKKDLVLKKSHLPFTYALKMALISFKRKKFKLFMTVLLTAISLIFMGFTLNFNLFNKTDLIVNTMMDNKDYIYEVNKFDYRGNSSSNKILTNNDIKEIEAKTNKTVNKVYSIFYNGEYLHFEFGENDGKDDLYPVSLISFNLVEISDDKILNKVIGRLPENSNEIVVHKYFVDYCQKYGIKTTDKKLYYPKSYQDMINSKQQLILGDNKVTVVGVIDDDDTLFNKVKDNKSLTIGEKGRLLSNYLEESYRSKGQDIYVKGLADNIKLKIDKNSLLKRTYIGTNSRLENTTTISGNIKSLTKKINILTDKNNVDIASLNKDEVILSLDSLKLLDNNFDAKFNEYIKNNPNENYDTLETKFIVQYLNETLLPPLYISIMDFDYKLSDSLVKVVGISQDGNDYVSNKYIEEYNPVPKKIYTVKIFDDDRGSLTSTFNNLKYSEIFFSYNELPSGEYYTYKPETNYEAINNIIATYRGGAVYILIITLIFILFTFLLFSNFIGVSISYCKKEIGILKALGANNKDILKIFGYESLIIGLIAWIISVIGWYIVCDLLNKSLFSKYYYIIKGIVASPLLPIILLGFVVIIALLITAVSTSRITRIKPIDAILDK